MKIFISHAFDDEDLASKLRKILETSDQIEVAYMAQKSPDFDIEIADKITREIKNSDYLVAIITKTSKQKPSVHQELGYAQGVETLKIPLIEKDTKIGVLLEGKDRFEFDRASFENSCKQVLEHILRKGPKPKFSKEEENYVQKSAHFRFEIRQHLDDILDSIIYRLQVVPENNRDLVFEDYEKRTKLFADILKFFNHDHTKFSNKDNTPIEKHFLKLPLDRFRRFSDEFEQFRADIKETEKLPHNDLFPDELDAYQKFNKTSIGISEENFDIENDVQKYFEVEEIRRMHYDFSEILMAHPNMVPTPLKNYLRYKLNSLANITKAIILLEQEIDKIHQRFGEIALKGTYID